MRPQRRRQPSSMPRLLATVLLGLLVTAVPIFAQQDDTTSVGVDTPTYDDAPLGDSPPDSSSDSAYDYDGDYNQDLPPLTKLTTGFLEQAQSVMRQSVRLPASLFSAPNRTCQVVYLANPDWASYELEVDFNALFNVNAGSAAAAKIAQCRRDGRLAVATYVDGYDVPNDLSSLTFSNEVAWAVATPKDPSAATLAPAARRRHLQHQHQHSIHTGSSQRSALQMMGQALGSLRRVLLQDDDGPAAPPSPTAAAADTAPPSTPPPSSLSADDATPSDATDTPSDATDTPVGDSPNSATNNMLRTTLNSLWKQGYVVQELLSRGDWNFNPGPSNLLGKPQMVTERVADGGHSRYVPGAQPPDSESVAYDINSDTIFAYEADDSDCIQVMRGPRTGRSQGRRKASGNVVGRYDSCYVTQLAVYIRNKCSLDGLLTTATATGRQAPPPPPPPADASVVALQRGISQTLADLTAQLASQADDNSIGAAPNATTTTPGAGGYIDLTVRYKPFNNCPDLPAESLYQTASTSLTAFILIASCVCGVLLIPTFFRAGVEYPARILGPKIKGLVKKDEAKKGDKDKGEEDEEDGKAEHGAAGSSSSSSSADEDGKKAAAAAADEKKKPTKPLARSLRDEETRYRANPVANMPVIGHLLRARKHFLYAITTVNSVNGQSRLLQVCLVSALAVAISLTVYTPKLDTVLNVLSRPVAVQTVNASGGNSKLIKFFYILLYCCVLGTLSYYAMLANFNHPGSTYYPTQLIISTIFMAALDYILLLQCSDILSRWTKLVEPGPFIPLMVFQLAVISIATIMHVLLIVQWVRRMRGGAAPPPAAAETTISIEDVKLELKEKAAAAAAELKDKAAAAAAAKKQPGFIAKTLEVLSCGRYKAAKEGDEHDVEAVKQSGDKEHDEDEHKEPSLPIRLWKSVREETYFRYPSLVMAALLVCSILLIHNYGKAIVWSKAVLMDCVADPQSCIADLLVKRRIIADKGTLDMNEGLLRPMQELLAFKANVTNILDKAQQTDELDLAQASANMLFAITEATVGPMGNMRAARRKYKLFRNQFRDRFNVTCVIGFTIGLLLGLNTLRINAAAFKNAITRFKEEKWAYRIKGKKGEQEARERAKEDEAVVAAGHGRDADDLRAQLVTVKVRDTPIGFSVLFFGVLLSTAIIQLYLVGVFLSVLLAVISHPYFWTGFVAKHWGMIIPIIVLFIFNSLFLTRYVAHFYLTDGKKVHRAGAWVAHTLIFSVVNLITGWLLALVRMVLLLLTTVFALSNLERSIFTVATFLDAPHKAFLATVHANVVNDSFDDKSYLPGWRGAANRRWKRLANVVLTTEADEFKRCAEDEPEQDTPAKESGESSKADTGKGGKDHEANPQKKGKGGKGCFGGSCLTASRVKQEEGHAADAAVARSDSCDSGGSSGSQQQANSGGPVADGAAAAGVPNKALAVVSADARGHAPAPAQLEQLPAVQQQAGGSTSHGAAADEPAAGRPSEAQQGRANALFVRD